MDFRCQLNRYLRIHTFEAGGDDEAILANKQIDLQIVIIAGSVSLTLNVNIKFWQKPVCLHLINQDWISNAGSKSSDSC